DGILARLRAGGIENILALRGDPPAGAADFDYSACDFRYAVDLVRYLRRQADLCIGAAAYPEGHISSPRLSTDLAYLKEKVDAGVDFLITQLFFDNRVFYNFLENARRTGIACPVSAGILPVLNAGQIKRIVSLCGASIPAKLWLMVDRYADAPEDLERAGIEYASAQIADLVANGVDGVHLYTLNRVEPAAQILRNVGLA
ncbi:MAG: methylenetetrahydrofolate reductase, partial [Bacillota bacterium]